MRISYLATTLAMLLAGSALADSPQFRGPERDGKFPDTGLMKSWPEGGPPVIWVADGIGDGYAAPSVVGDTIYVPGMLQDGKGYLFALGLDGREKWRMAYGVETKDAQAPGSRSTPTIVGGRAYIMSGMGVLYCIDLATRQIDWKVNILQRFGAENIDWSIAESVLVDEGLVFCTPGSPSVSVAALDKRTGDTVWTAAGVGKRTSYCSPGIIERGGTRLLVTETSKFVIGIDAKTGILLWKHPHPTKYDIHAVTPVYADGMIYYTAGYRSGGGMLALSADGKSVQPVWQDKNLDVQHHGVILLDGYLYGTAHQSGREMICLELATGRIAWRTREVSQGVVIYADGMIYLYEGPRKGIVSLIRATPDGFHRTGQFTLNVGDGKHWAHPAIAGKRLYIRHGKALAAYDIAAR